MCALKITSPTPDDVRQAAASVAARARHVRIAAEKIPAYVERLLATYPITTALDDNHLSDPAPERTATYLLALDSLNFGSGYFREARDEGADFGYAVFARGLKNAFRDGFLDTPEKWRKASACDFHRIFSIPEGRYGALDELFTHFARHLKQSGDAIMRQYGGRVMHLVEDCRGTATRLVETLSGWPGFADIAHYHGQDVPLLKRAQILAADLDLAGIGNFSDMDRLTIFADNRVPHVLRHDGILEYDENLGARIDAKIPLPSGSPEEVELRALSIHAAEMMMEEARKSGHDVTSVNIDHILWRRGGETAFAQKPSHRTRSVWY